MTRARIDTLTERERDCLRLVSRGRSSKEIGAELGISHHTVDLYLKRAIKSLEATSRRDAARQLELAEANDNQGLVTQPPAIAEPLPLTSISTPNWMEPPPRFRVPFLRQGRQRNDLNVMERLGWIGALAVAILFVIANFFNGLAALFAITA